MFLDAALFRKKCNSNRKTWDVFGEGMQRGYTAVTGHLLVQQGNTNVRDEFLIFSWCIKQELTIQPAMKKDKIISQVMLSILWH